MFFAPVAINEIATEACVHTSLQVSEYQLATAGGERWPSAWSRLAAFDTVFSNQPDVTRHDAWKRLLEVSKLAPNWDAYGAEPIEAACAANAEALLRTLPSAAPSPEITPNPNGTLSFDWDSDGRALSLEIGVRRYSCFWESASGLKTAEGELDQPLPDFVAIALTNLFPQPLTSSISSEEFVADA